MSMSSTLPWFPLIVCSGNRQSKPMQLGFDHTFAEVHQKRDPANRHAFSCKRGDLRKDVCGDV